ncbi:MAG: hypothetical protein ABJD68_01225 [Nakamurella sp.]
MIQADALTLLVPSIGIPALIAIPVVPFIILTIYRYDWIHRFRRIMTPILGSSSC